MQLPSSPCTLAPLTRSLHFLRSDLCSHFPRQEGLAVTLTRQSTRGKTQLLPLPKSQFLFLPDLFPLEVNSLLNLFLSYSHRRWDSTSFNCCHFPPCPPSNLSAHLHVSLPRTCVQSCLFSEQKLSLTPKCLPDGQFLCLITYRNVISFITLSRNIILSAITFLMRHLRASHLICSQSILSDKYSVV